MRGVQEDPRLRVDTAGGCAPAVAPQWPHLGALHDLSDRSFSPERREAATVATQGQEGSGPPALVTRRKGVTL